MELSLALPIPFYNSSLPAKSHDCVRHPAHRSGFLATLWLLLLPSCPCVHVGTIWLGATDAWVFASIRVMHGWE